MRDRFIKGRREFLAAGLVALPLLKVGACEAAESCRPTARGAGGPYYRKGAPWTARLCGAEEPGTPLVVEGRVTAADTCRPLEGAVVEVFQANDAGLYDVQMPGHRPDLFRLRGQLRADAAGRYRFETVLPGNYTDGIARARHIHYVVSAPGYRPLVTECYFKGEPRNETDRLVRPELIIALDESTRDRRKQLAATFDLVLAKA